MLLGAHLSIAGCIERPLLEAHRYGFNTVGMFVRSNVRWRAPRLTDQAVAAFRRTRERLGIGPVVAHGMYLANLAARAALRRRSIAAVRDELDRCGRLGIDYLVIHPGLRDDAELAVRLIAEALDRIIAACRHRRPKVLLETTAGGRNSIGGTFEQLAKILAMVRHPNRLGVCIDTCHMFAAGYDIRSASAYRRTMSLFDSTIGLDRLLAVHVSDSKRPLGSRIDRHEHIGRGHIGLEGLANLVNDGRLAGVPLILETPKGPSRTAWAPAARRRTDHDSPDWDELNAAALRALVRRAPRRTGG